MTTPMTTRTSTLGELETPALLLDRERLRANCARMRAIAEERGVRLRPHLKTVKSVRVAEEIYGGAIPEGARATVSTLREAEHFFAHGITDLLYAVAATPGRLPRAARLLQRGAELSLITDDPACAHKIAEAGAALGVYFPVMIELDVGLGRGGLRWDSQELIELGRILAHGAGTRLKGVMSHAGQSYACRSKEEIREVAERERAETVGAADRLRRKGLTVEEVSVGSTPTALFGRHLAGVTELRAGVYAFFDLFQQALGCCAEEDLALSVLSTVIGKRPKEGLLLIDAGALALSADRSMDAFGGGYGELRALDGGYLAGAPRVRAIHQEHGWVRGSDRFDPDAFEVGDRLRVLPNHACLTAACFESYQVHEGQEKVAEWPRFGGWWACATVSPKGPRSPRSPRPRPTLATAAPSAARPTRSAVSPRATTWWTPPGRSRRPIG